ncbi:hypothetical protein FQN50_003274 [Emmonsiellopsis sp. PD_5]|nr:hypothetical protein FQN50_003274 [Emmonsiellopsis sp. PD_5]
MPVPKQTTELIFALRALIYRLRQLRKERHGYSKAKHRELAKLLKEGREDLARIKTEDVIGNDNVIAALEILELYCEQLHVRANILDHIALGQKRGVPRRKAGAETRTGSAGTATSTNIFGGGGGGWGIWKALGFGSSQTSPPPSAEQSKQNEQPSPSEEQTTTPLPAKDDTILEKDIYLDPDLDKAAAVIFYSYTHLPRDVPGLPELRLKLIQRWGNDFANKAQEGDPSIPLPADIVDRLKVQNPPESLVENYLKEIAKAHGVAWREEEEEEEVSEGEEGGDGAEKEEIPPAYPTDEAGVLQAGNMGKTGNIKESGKAGLPQNTESDDKEIPTTARAASPAHHHDKPSAEMPKPKAQAPPEAKRGGIPEVDELARRFAALKR